MINLVLLTAVTKEGSMLIITLTTFTLYSVCLAAY